MVRQKRILLAEDSRVNQAVALAFLRRAGYEVDTVENGWQVIQTMLQHRYDLVLMDLVMPEMDGFQATAAIRRLPPPQGCIPIIAMTGHDQPEDLQYCLAAGMNDYLAKPINGAVLLTALNLYLENPAGALDIDLLDLPTLSRLEADTDPDLLRQIIGLFIDETQRRIQAIGVALRAADWWCLQRQAHTLKSSASAFGAKALQNHARRLDEACLSQQRDQAAALAATIAEIAAPALQALARRYRAKDEIEGGF